MEGLSQNVLCLQVKGVLLLMTIAGSSSRAYVSQQCIHVLYNTCTQWL